MHNEPFNYFYVNAKAATARGLLLQFRGMNERGQFVGHKLDVEESLA